MKHESHVHIIRDDFNQAYRIWDSNDAGDQFDMIPIAEVEPHLPFIRRFPWLFVEGFPEDDAGEVLCEICARNKSRTL